MCNKRTTKYTNRAFGSVYSLLCYDPTKNPECAELLRHYGPCPDLEHSTIVQYNDHCNCKVTKEACCMILKPDQHSHGAVVWNSTYESESLDKGKQKEGEENEATKKDKDSLRSITIVLDYPAVRLTFRRTPKDKIGKYVLTKSPADGTKKHNASNLKITWVPQWDFSYSVEWKLKEHTADFETKANTEDFDGEDLDTEQKPRLGNSFR